MRLQDLFTTFFNTSLEDFINSIIPLISVLKCVCLAIRFMGFFMQSFKTNLWQTIRK